VFVVWTFKSIGVISWQKHSITKSPLKNLPMWLRDDRIPSDRNNFDRIRQSFCHILTGRILTGRIPIRISSEFDGTRLKFDQIRPGFHRVPLNSDEIRVGIRPTGIRQKLCRIRSVFHEKCRIPMKSDADPIENDRIFRSDWLSWVINWLAHCLQIQWMQFNTKYVDFLSEHELQIVLLFIY